MASDTDWTEETVARLRTLWAEGHSTAEIGRRMGTSKNAIIGKARRLQLAPRASPIREKGTGTPRRPAVPRVRGPSLPPLAAVAGSAFHPTEAAYASTNTVAGAAAGDGVQAACGQALVLLADRRARHARVPLLRRPGYARQALLRRACKPGLRRTEVRARPPGRPGARPLSAARADAHDLTA